MFVNELYPPRSSVWLYLNMCVSYLVPVSSINPSNNISTSLPTKIRIQGSVATDTTNLAKQDSKDGKATTGAKLLPAQTPTTNMGTPQHNGLSVKPVAAMTTVSPTSVASAIPVVQKGSHFHVQSGAVAQVGALQGTTRLAQVFPSNALSKVGVMTVPNMVSGSYARVPIQMTASASAPLLMRSPVPNVGKVTVSSPSETTPETATSTPGAEQDGHGVETKKVEKIERRDEVESVKKGDDEKVAKDNNGTESSEMKNVPNFLDDVDSLNEKKSSKNESQVKSKKNYTQKEEKKEKPMEQEESKDLLPLTVHNLEDDVKKESVERIEVKASEKIDSHPTEKDKFSHEIKKESKSKESEKSVDNGSLEEGKNPEGESNKSNKAGREDFDPVGAMDWKDGVGELEGSNLKVRVLSYLVCHEKVFPLHFIFFMPLP